VAEFATWRLEQDAREHLDRSAQLGLAELVDAQVAFFRGWPTDAGAMIALATVPRAAWQGCRTRPSP
jgi:hypothetical protein